MDRSNRLRGLPRKVEPFRRQKLKVISAMNFIMIKTTHLLMTMNTRTHQRELSRSECSSQKSSLMISFHLMEILKILFIHTCIRIESKRCKILRKRIQSLKTWLLLLRKKENLNRLQVQQQVLLLKTHFQQRFFQPLPL